MKMTILTREQDEGWKGVPPHRPESWRWQHNDGRWISLVLEAGEDVGFVTVADSTGRNVRLDSYEGALEMARSWRGG